MKLLSLVRHAKSSWQDPERSDFERELNSRGLRDAPDMASRLAIRRCIPELIISSPARRAQQTAEFMVKGLTLADENLVYEQEIYEATTGALLQIVQQLDPDVNHAMLVGHNPSMEQLDALLAGGRLSRMPTCAVSHFEIETPHWGSLTDAKITRLFYDFPKNTERENSNQQTVGNTH